MGIVFENMPRALDPIPGGGKLINAVDFVVNWARANSLWPLTFGTSCCAIEMMAAGASHQDWARFGVEVHRATPRQADLIILAGTIVEKMADRLVTLYEQMPVPKYVIAMGSCTITGGPFMYDSYSVIKGADRLIPVDVYIPGCPPRPEALLYGVMQLQELIKKETIRRPRTLRPLFKEPLIDLHTTAAKSWEAVEVKRQEELKPLQEQFKIDNPTYKAPVAQRKEAPKFDEVPRTPGPQLGLSNAAIFEKVRQKFPDISVNKQPEATAESIAALGTEYILDFEVSGERYVEVVDFLKKDLQCDFLLQITALDLKDRFEVLVHLLSIERGHKVFVRCALSHDEHPEIPTLCGVFESAEWHEREVYDFFGIKFTGHPDLRRLFLEDHFPGHPFRKDFADASRMVRRPY